MAVPAPKTPPTNNLLSLAPPLILASRFGWQPLRLAFVEQQQDCEQRETPACIEMRDAILDCLSISDKNALNSLVGGCLSISDQNALTFLVSRCLVPFWTACRFPTRMRSTFWSADA